MGWKGTLRSVNAIVRAAERDAERRNKIAHKERLLSQAAADVADWEEHIYQLVSQHTNILDPVDWKIIATSPEPTPPLFKRPRTERADRALKQFTPGFFDFIHGGSLKKRQKLENSLELASQRDAQEHEREKENFDKELDVWKYDTRLASKALVEDREAFRTIILKFEALLRQSVNGKNISFWFPDTGFHALTELYTDEIIPKFRRKLLASGKLSETNMPVGQLNEYYKDYVASSALKIAGDLFSLLPANDIYVTCQTKMLNSETGHQELTTILSVKFVRNTFTKLNLDHIDPSDSLRNFEHNISFRKTKGFSAVEPLKSFE